MDIFKDFPGKPDPKEKFVPAFDFRTFGQERGLSSEETQAIEAAITQLDTGVKMMGANGRGDMNQKLMANWEERARAFKDKRIEARQALFELAHPMLSSFDEAGRKRFMLLEDSILHGEL